MSSAVTRLLCFQGDGPYWENAPELMAWPEGVRFERPFRYRSQWIPNRFRDKLNTWKESEVVVCLKGKTDPDLYVPLRFAKVDNVEPHGEYTFIYFVLLGYVQYDSSRDLKQFSSIISSSIPAQEREKLVGECSRDCGLKRTSSASVDSNWDFVTTRFTSEPAPAFANYASTIFPRVLALIEAKNAVLVNEIKDYRYSLKVDTDYSLKIQVVMPNASIRGLQMEPFDVRVEGPFEPAMPARVAVTSPYDLVLLSFHTALKAVSGSLSLPGTEVRAIQATGSTRTLLQFPPINIPLTVAPSAGQVIQRSVLPMVLIGTGITLSGVASIIASLYAGGRQDIQSALATIGAILATFGIKYLKT